jgi:hypothetical protein
MPPRHALSMFSFTAYLAPAFSPVLVLLSYTLVFIMLCAGFH